MWMSYTLYSKALGGEETINLLMPHPHQVQAGRYTKADLYENRRRLPVLVAMGDEGTESNWWVRHSFAEGDIQTSIAAVVCVRGMAPDEKAVRFIADELPALLCAQFPMDAQNMAFLGWEGSRAFLGRLEGGRYRMLTGGGTDDCVKAMQQVLAQLTEKE